MKETMTKTTRIKINGEKFSENVVLALKLLNKDETLLEYFSGFGNRIRPRYRILGVPNPKEGTSISTATGKTLRAKNLVKQVPRKEDWASTVYKISERGKKILEGVK